MSFPRYPKYKDSNVEWLGAVPEHWRLSRLKHVAAAIPFPIVDGPFGTQLKAEDYRESGIPLVRISNLSYTGCFSEEDLVFIDPAKAAEVSRSALRNGDVIVGKTGATIGKCALFELRDGGIVASSCLKISPDEEQLVSKFLLFTIVSDGFQKTLINESGGSTRDTINITPFSNLPIAVPAVSEQLKIVNFLNRETAKIDALVVEQQRLIELLNEKRQAVMSHAVTKGLNSSVPMKASGIDWFGNVPAHWKVVALKHLVSRPIIDGPHVTPMKRDEGIPFVSAESVSGGFINFDKLWGFVSPEDHAEYSKRYSPKRNDILMVKLGATTGTTAIVETDKDFSIWVPLAAIRLKTEIEPRFVLHVLRSDSLRRAYELSWTYGTQQTLGLKTISNLRIPLPPKEEQQEIARRIDSMLPAFESLTAEAQRAIGLLLERRAALISAAVTGQIDVRRFPEKEAA